MVLPNLSALRLEPTGPEPQRQRVDLDGVVPYNPTVGLPDDLQEELLMRAVKAAEKEFMALPTIEDDPDRCGLPYPTLKRGVAMEGDLSDVTDYEPTMTKETFVPSDTAISICLVSPANAEVCGAKLVRLLCYMEHSYYPEEFARRYQAVMPNPGSYDLTWILTCILARDGILIDWETGTGRLVNPRVSNARHTNAPFPGDPQRLSWREVLGHLLRARTWLPYHITAFRQQMQLRPLVATEDEEDVVNGLYTLQHAKRRVIAGQQLVRALDFADYMHQTRPRVYGERTVERYKRYIKERLEAVRRLDRAKNVIRDCGPPHAWDTSAVTDFSYALARAERYDEDRYNGAEDLYSGEAPHDRHASPYYFWNGLWKIWHWEIDAQVLDAGKAIVWIMENSRPNWPIGLWDTSRAITMDGIFKNNRAFNQPINAWNVSSVDTMQGAFEGARAFNQPLDKWEPKALETVTNLFYGATQFSQNLDAWYEHLDTLRTRLTKELAKNMHKKDGLKIFELHDAYVDNLYADVTARRKLCRWGPTAWGLHELVGAN